MSHDCRAFRRSLEQVLEDARGPQEWTSLSWHEHLLGCRDGLAAALVSLVLLLVLIVPLTMLSRALVDDGGARVGAVLVQGQRG